MQQVGAQRVATRRRPSASFVRALLPAVEAALQVVATLQSACFMRSWYEPSTHANFVLPSEQACPSGQQGAGEAGRVGQAVSH